MTGGEFVAVDHDAFASEKAVTYADGYELRIVPANFCWAILNRGMGYAYTRIDRPGGRRLSVYLHRLLMNAPHGSLVNHIDFDPRNNRLENLEFASPYQNTIWTKRRSDFFARKGWTCAAHIIPEQVTYMPRKAR
jgi:hypothetical protein